MRRELIEVGNVYRDEKGSARRVCRLRQLDDYSWAVQVEYQLIEGAPSRPADRIGPNGEKFYRCDIISFQRWAKSFVKVDAINPKKKRLICNQKK